MSPADVARAAAVVRRRYSRGRLWLLRGFGFFDLLGLVVVLTAPAFLLGYTLSEAVASLDVQPDRESLGAVMVRAWLSVVCFALVLALVYLVVRRLTDRLRLPGHAARARRVVAARHRVLGRHLEEPSPDVDGPPAEDVDVEDPPVPPVPAERAPLDFRPSRRADAPPAFDVPGHVAQTNAVILPSLPPSGGA